MRRKYKYIALVVLLFLSIGFAILSSNLNIGSSIGISNASFDVHIEDAVIYQTNVSEVSNPVINRKRCGHVNHNCIVLLISSYFAPFSSVPCSPAGLYVGVIFAT